MREDDVILATRCERTAAFLFDVIVLQLLCFFYAIWLISMNMKGQFDTNDFPLHVRLIGLLAFFCIDATFIFFRHQTFGQYLVGIATKSSVVGRRSMPVLRTLLRRLVFLGVLAIGMFGYFAFCFCVGISFLLVGDFLLCPLGRSFTDKLTKTQVFRKDPISAA